MAIGKAADLLFGLNKLTDAITGSLEFAQRTEKASLSLGMTFLEARKELGPTLKGLHGTMKDRMSVGLETVAAGLQGNNSGIALLINQQKLTGQAFKQTAKIFAGVEAAGIGTTTSLNSLAENTITLGDQYRVSTEVLTRVIQSLEKNMTDMGLADMGPHVIGAIQQLQSTLGPQFEGRLKTLIGMIFDTSQETYANLAKLGIPLIREQLSASTSQKEAFSLFAKGIQKAGIVMDEFTGTADAFFPMIGVAKDVFGRLSTDISPVAKALREGVRERDLNLSFFFKQISTLWDDAVVPLQDALSQNVDACARVCTAAVSNMLEPVCRKIEGFIKTLPSAPEAKVFKEIIITTILSFVDGFEHGAAKFDFFFNQKLPDVINYVVHWLKVLGDELPIISKKFAFGIEDMLQGISDIPGVPDFMPTSKDKAKAYYESFTPAMHHQVMDEFEDFVKLRDLQEDTGNPWLRGWKPSYEMAAAITADIHFEEGREWLRGWDPFAEHLEARKTKAREGLLQAEMSQIDRGQPPGVRTWNSYVEAGGLTRRDETMTAIKDFLEKVDENTEKAADELETFNESWGEGGILGEAAFILSDAVDAVLGFKGDDGASEQRERQIVLQEEMAERLSLQHSTGGNASLGAAQ